MMRLALMMLLLTMATITPANAESSNTALTVERLRCEYLVNPLGIDAMSPRLGWVPQSSVRGQRQTAYQILAATDPQVLAADRGDLWDSGKVDSHESVHVLYGGQPLASGQRVYWKVRVWGRDGEPSPYSEPAWWEMGLLKPEDWRGQWLAAHPDRHQMLAPFDTARMRWIWWPEANPDAAPPKDQSRFFRRTFELPADRTITRAQLLLTGDDHYVLHINGQQVGTNDYWQMLRVYDLTAHLQPGTNALAVVIRNYGDAAGLIAQLRVDFVEGEPLVLSTDTAWQSSDEDKPGWTDPGFDATGWQACRDLGPFGGAPWGELYLLPEPRSAPLFRKSFTVAKPVKAAQAYICGLGYHELYLNNERIGDHVLDPAFTNYDHRALYVTHDVTEQIKPGKNAIGVMLGNGWYNMHTRAVWLFDKAPWRDVPCLRMQLHLTFEDGSQETIHTDPTWKTAPGPILFDAIRNGEAYDARLERNGWASPDCDDADWQPPHVVRGPAGRLVPQTMPAIQVTQTIQPVAMSEPQPGIFVFDLGQNLAGWARLTVKGPAGTRVTLKYGERLNADGTVNQDLIAAHSLQAPFQTDTYILKGDGAETWEPRFVYHGFQYVEVSGWPGKPALDNLQGRFAHTACPQVGNFECSNTLFGRIQRAARWSYWGNFHGYPTDCPHREKNGWTGDAHMASEQAMYSFDNAAAYAKWIDDMRDAMKDDGQLPGIVPTGGWGYHWGNGPAWDIAYLTIPWQLYLYHGDRGILERHYAGFKRYVDYMTSRAEGHIVSFGLGDWVAIDQKTPEAVTSTGYYYRGALLVSQTATLLGKLDDAKRYADLAGRIRKAFNAKFYDRRTGQYATGSQTALACALYHGLVEPDQVDRVVANLVANIEKCDGHINSGVLGSIYIPHALTRYGRPDVAYTLAAKTTYPSWGHWIQQGATTLWEDWKGEASLNHIFFGDICTWFYQALAGIRVDPEQPAFEHILIRPEILGDLTWAKGEIDTVRGKVASHWQLADGALTLTVTIPANSTATVFLPASDPSKVTESGRSAAESPGVRFIKAEGGRCTYAVDSGQYVFATPWP